MCFLPKILFSSLKILQWFFYKVGIPGNAKHNYDVSSYANKIYKCINTYAQFSLQWYTLFLGSFVNMYFFFFFSFKFSLVSFSCINLFYTVIFLSGHPNTSYFITSRVLSCFSDHCVNYHLLCKNISYVVLIWFE